MYIYFLMPKLLQHIITIMPERIVFLAFVDLRNFTLKYCATSGNARTPIDDSRAAASLFYCFTGIRKS